MKKEGKTVQFRKVGECLYRHASSKVYYGLVKRNGKQIRKSLKTTDRKLAERRVKDFREKVERLEPGKEVSQATFEVIATRWLEIKEPNLKEKTVLRAKGCVRVLNRHFGRHAVRKITRSQIDQCVSKRSPSVAALTFNKEREAWINVLD